MLPTATTRIRRSTELRRVELIEIARKILSSRGGEGLTIRAIAEDAGFTEAAIYRHFRSKDEILFGLLDEIDRTLPEWFAEVRARSREPIEQLEQILKEHLSYTERRRGVTFLVMTEILHNGNRQLSQRVRAMLRRYVDTIAEIVRQGVAEGQFNPGVDPEAVAITLFGIVQSSVTFWRFNAQAQPLTAHLEGLWTACRDGIRAR